MSYNWLEFNLSTKSFFFVYLCSKVNNYICRGVILYVMGTGRLPFQSPRDGLSPEQRRRRLMAQINYGLAGSQARLIAQLSDEYKNLVHRLLTPKAHQRINIHELCCHPWILGCLQKAYIVEHERLDDKSHLAVLRFIIFIQI